MTSDFVQAQSPVEGPGTPVDDEGVQGKAPALPASLVQKAADEPAAGAKISVVGVDLDPRQVGLRRPVLDVEHACGGVIGEDDLPSARAAHTGVEVMLDLFVSALPACPRRTHRIAHTGHLYRAAPTRDPDAT
ncbi:hypothetical protein PV336_27630 [Streptomyces sp. MI02-2A]|nr:hypothetical protein [Streptomyces sp. MI02-2A]MDX3262953.1 hypothetical protein [Streptomyces sp. MI02-2A]